MSSVNLELNAELIKRFGTQVEASSLGDDPGAAYKQIRVLSPLLLGAEHKASQREGGNHKNFSKREDL